MCRHSERFIKDKPASNSVQMHLVREHYNNKNVREFAKKEKYFTQKWQAQNYNYNDQSKTASLVQIW